MKRTDLHSPDGELHRYCASPGSSRRSFVAAGLTGLAATAIGPMAGASTPASSAPQHAAPKPIADMPSGALRFYHIHTAEKLNVHYRSGRAVIASALGDIDHLMRDFRNGQETQIDLGLLDQLSRLYDHFGRQGWYEIVSGYRSPRTNAALRRVTSGVAEDSFHMQGRAIDVRLVGIHTDRLRDAALAMRLGGVGYYPESNFVHLDTGRFRSW